MDDFQLLESLNHWTWWAFGVVLVILEILAPGAVFVWLGIAAGIMGFVALIGPGMSWEVQITLFAVLSVVSVVAGRMYVRRHPTHTEDTGLNRRGEQYIGRLFTLDEPIVNGNGKMVIDDTTWKIEGEDLPAGTRVKVTGVSGVLLQVETA